MSGCNLTLQRAQIALMVQCDARKAYGLMKQVLESEARLSYTAWKLLLSDGVVAELLAGEPGANLRRSIVEKPAQQYGR